MIANFFQSLDERKVEYLLISGQATVLYGAATFSEDIDLWINPTLANRDKFLSALRSCQARYYKLTPELTLEHLVRGHGFHFLLPDGQGREIFLDVLGAPPRVLSFVSAAAGAKWIETEWGNLHTIGIKDLVELKKTQRLEDYAIISKLVLAWFYQSDSSAKPEDYVWAMENLFTLAEFHTLLSEQPAASKAFSAIAPAAFKEFARQHLATGEISELIEQEVSACMQQKMAGLQQADRHYWREIIADLRKIRAGGGLMAQSAEV